jgi:pyrroline-5-carboxylate reductase
MRSLKPPYSLTLVGCGKMGSALIAGWLNKHLIRHADIIEPNPIDKALSEQKAVTHKTSFASGFIQTDILVLATKPQTLALAVKDINGKISKDTLVLSIAAGQSLASLASLFPKDQPIIRSMPNTPASIGKAATVAIANRFVSPDQKDMANTLIGASGTISWLEKESMMDAVTALSGSGPAYVFYLIEVLAKAGENRGLSPDLAMTLARQTIIGSAALAEYQADTAASTLRQNVTSSGGTTEAALKILMDGRFQDLFNDALKMAEKRGKELNKN